MGNLLDGMNREMPMLKKALLTVALAGAVWGAFGMVSSSPAVAAKDQKPTGACAQPGNRCVSDCDPFNWCQVYTCVNGQSTPVPFWRCFEPSGLCLAPRC
jgi:hypothetical protein